MVFRKRLWFLNSILLIVSLSTSLLFVELILRTRDWYHVARGGFQQQLEANEPYEFSTTRHHRLVGNARYRHKELEYDYIWANNSLGMRDRERSPHKEPGSFRILFLGDSFVQGLGVPLEQTMAALLETSLNKPELEKRVEVLNGGVFGYSPFLEYLYLKELMPSIEPDLVIIGFFLGNDVGDDYFYTKQARVNKADGSVFFEDHQWPWSYRDEVLDSTANTGVHDRFLSLIWNFIKPWLFKSHLVLAIKQLGTQLEYRKRNEREINLVQDRRDDIRINLGLVNYPVLDRGRRLEYWKLSWGYLADIRHLCNVHGIPMLLVVIPVLDAEVNQFKEPYEVLDEIARDLSIPVIQLLPEFQKWPQERLEYKIDRHWNSEGNRLAATILDRELRKQNLLPPTRSQ
jgi:hypothetical protein